MVSPFSFVDAMDDTPVLLPPFHPALLPLNTVVGAWRVESLAGCGVFGAVYRALPVHDEHAPPVALKLAMFPSDPRFVREAELLSRCHHPSIPRLLEQGTWHSPAGTSHPYLIMDWVDGVPLYEQARHRSSHPAQMRRWLMQVAQALAALHAQGGVHRDLKGGNILVRRSDARAMLMDFGTGLYPGAAPVTPPMKFPGTPVYRSPESWLFEIRFYRDDTARYLASPADDLYALGVTACRLLTEQYPHFGSPYRDAQGDLHLEGIQLPRALMRNPYIDPALRALTLRLLSANPEQRGTATQVAQELESTLKPLQHRASRRWALAAAGLLLAIGGWWTLSSKHPLARAVARAEPLEATSAKARTSGLGDAATILATEKAPDRSMAEGMSEDALPKPVPGQVRPDEKGRCPLKGLVSLNGACWAETSIDREGCPTLGGQMFKGTCYVPFIPPPGKRPPTSTPTNNP